MDCQDDRHFWYSVALAPSRFIKRDWCVNCGIPNPTYSLDDWEDNGPDTPEGELQGL